MPKFSLQQTKLEISPIFHRTLELIVKDYLLEKERILLVVECVHHYFSREKKFSIFRDMLNVWEPEEYKDVSSDIPSLLVVTNKQWIRKPQPFYSTHGSRIYESADSFGRMLKAEYRTKTNWAYPYRMKLTEKQLSQVRQLRDDFSLHNLKVTPLNTIRARAYRKAFIQEEDRAVPILSITLSERTEVSLRYRDGEKLRKILQQASVDSVTGEVEANSELKDLEKKLKTLKSMLAKKLITKSEYEKKRKEILSGL